MLPPGSPAAATSIVSGGSLCFVLHVDQKDGSLKVERALREIMHAEQSW